MPAVVNFAGGAEGDRTPDLVNAIHALSQLSYGPMSVGKPGQAFVLAARLSRPRRAIVQVGDTRLDKTRKVSPPWSVPSAAAACHATGGFCPIKRFQVRGGKRVGQPEMPRA